MSESPPKSTESSHPGHHDPVATLRHDLRTPLNQIIGYSEMLQEEAQDSGQTSLDADLAKILKASRHLLGMINRVVSPDQIQLLKDLPDLRRVDDVSVAHPSLPSSQDLSVVLPKIIENEKEVPSEDKGQANILVVDDDTQNCDLLSRRLIQEGYAVFQAFGGRDALEKLRSDLVVDVVLLDVLMPEMDGFEVLVQIKEDEKLRHIPVIMISALDQLDSVIQCIQHGADDYLGKPFNLTFLRARLGASLDRKRLRDQEQRTYLALKKTQEQLVAELAEAEAYVRTQLPERLTGAISTDWKFVSSSSLGGDAFGYKWIDEHHFSMYLLDVCGHGVGAALLSISALKTLDGHALPDVDFLDPSQVCKALNETFNMEHHNNMYFTLWYGVYDSRTCELTYASAGHPPALLLPPSKSGEDLEQLRTPNLFIGGLPDIDFVKSTCKIPPGSRFYVLSDGVYEIRRPDKPMMSLKDLTHFLLEQPPESTTILEDLWAMVHREHGEGILEDDFSIMEFRFNPPA